MSTTIVSGADIFAESEPKAPAALVRLVDTTFQMQVQNGSGKVEDFATYDEALFAAQTYADKLDTLTLPDKDRVAIKQLLVAKDAQIESLDTSVATKTDEIATLTQRILDLEAQVADLEARLPKL